MSVHNHHNLHPHHHSQIYSRSSNITNLTPNSCLLAVLLVTRCSSGPSLTFHYPPRPRLDSSPLSRSARSTSPTSSSSSSSSGEDDDADENSRTTATAPLLLPLHAAAPVAAAAAAAAAATAASDTDTRSYLSRRGGPGGGEDGGEKDRSSSSSSSRKKPGGYDTVLGFKSDFLAGLLAPKAAVAAKDRFEMSVDDVVFLGAPVQFGLTGCGGRERSAAVGALSSMKAIKWAQVVRSITAAVAVLVVVVRLRREKGRGVERELRVWSRRAVRRMQL